MAYDFAYTRLAKGADGMAVAVPSKILFSSAALTAVDQSRTSAAVTPV
jgi:hypothetical protein